MESLAGTLMTLRTLMAGGGGPKGQLGGAGIESCVHVRTLQGWGRARAGRGCCSSQRVLTSDLTWVAVRKLV